MANILNLANAVSTAATGAGPAIALNSTPFLGGQAHEAILNLGAAIPAGVTVKLQGHPAANGKGDPTPATGDTGWYDVVTLTPTSQLQSEIADLPAWIRYNVTVAAAGTVTANLEGVQ